MTTKTDATPARPEMDLGDVLAARVRAGQPIHIGTARLDEAQMRLHVADVMRLRRETGMPVHVIYG